MAIAGSPKKLAQDVAGGYTSFNQSGLKKYSPADLKDIINNLAIVARELRAEPVSQDDALAMKAKNMRLSRLNQASVVIRTFCKKGRIPI